MKSARKSFSDPEKSPKGQPKSLSRRLFLALALMLLPLVVVAGAGVLTFRSSVKALEEISDETVEESTPIARVRDLLVRADDVGEKYVEMDSARMGERFGDIETQINRGFVELTALSPAAERDLAASARLRWERAIASLDEAISLPAGRDGARLDEFHDVIDESGSLLSDAYALNVDQVAGEISSLQHREQNQLWVALAILLISSLATGLLARRLRRSITTPLASLKRAALELGSDELSHRIPITGDDELASVSRAFNTMAGKLQESRDDLSYQVLHDPLTGLPNRTLFMERMEHAIARTDRRGTPFSVLYLDLDGFKAVNDTLGHETGDEVLKAVSRHLSGSLRAGDTAARLGGDEFAVLLEEADEAGAAETAERLVSTFSNSWPRRSTQTPIAFSIGVATRRSGEELDLLLRQADSAMYAAKTAGKGQWKAFGPGLGSDAVELQSLRSDLQRAVDRKEFIIHYQPVVNLQNQAIVGVEALVRWNHPERGLLPPAEFLDEAERSGHILFIDRWVLQEACNQVRAWQEDIPDAVGLRAWVNLSARQLQHPGLAEEVAEALASSGLAAQDLTLEITETALVRDTEAASTELRRLKKLGVSLALDDFGTGYSSLAHLLSFPIDVIKIDRSFVSAIGGDSRRSELALALVQLAKTLRLKTVAEGIETEGQLDSLRTLDCELGQGYYLAKPVDKLKLEKLLHGSLLLGEPDAPMITRLP